MLNVVYDESMVVRHLEDPGPSKAARVMKRVMDLPDVLITKPGKYASVEQLQLAHDPGYVHGIMVGTRDNGFGTVDIEITSQARACVAAMIIGTEIAIREKTTVAVPCSGFHHAGWDANWGYCTFNGLVIAIAEHRRVHGFDPQKVLILDGDAHDGDGTRSCIANTKLTYVANLGGAELHHERWADTIGTALRSQPWDLIMYQAGADAHKDDPYGAGYLTDDDWFHRDTMVFDYCAKERVPLVFNFAGGYAGEKTEDLHYRSVRAAAKSLLRYPPAPTELKAAD